MIDFTPYPSHDDDTLITRYSKVCTSLAQHREYLAQQQAQERRVKIKAFWDSNGDSVAKRDRESNFHTVEITATILETEGSIIRLIDEREFIEHLMEWRYASRKG